ncbi:MAG: hypothetical protein AAF434_17220 [Pseudomonadota bacterium]
MSKELSKAEAKAEKEKKEATAAKRAATIAKKKAEKEQAEAEAAAEAVEKLKEESRDVRVKIIRDRVNTSKGRFNNGARVTLSKFDARRLIRLGMAMEL